MQVCCMLYKEQNKTKFSTLCLSMENLVNSSLTFNIFFQEISWKRLILKLLKETIGRIWFGSMKRFNCDSLILWLTLHLYTFFRYFIKRKMKSVIFKSSIIYSFITLMIVIFLLTVICDLKYINDKKTEVNESMKYEDQLNMFLSNLRSKGEWI